MTKANKAKKNSKEKSNNKEVPQFDKRKQPIKPVTSICTLIKRVKRVLGTAIALPKGVKRKSTPSWELTMSFNNLRTQVVQTEDNISIKKTLLFKKIKVLRIKI